MEVFCNAVLNENYFQIEANLPAIHRGFFEEFTAGNPRLKLDYFEARKPVIVTKPAFKLC